MNRTIKEIQKAPRYQCKFTGQRKSGVHRVVKVFAPREKWRPAKEAEYLD
jgi:hypothetical protein